MGRLLIDWRRNVRSCAGLRWVGVAASCLLVVVLYVCKYCFFGIKKNNRSFILNHSIVTCFVLHVERKRVFVESIRLYFRALPKILAPYIDR